MKKKPKWNQLLTSLVFQASTCIGQEREKYQANIKEKKHQCEKNNTNVRRAMTKVGSKGTQITTKKSNTTNMKKIVKPHKKNNITNVKKNSTNMKTTTLMQEEQQ
jgi:hypothetical protein